MSRSSQWLSALRSSTSTSTYISMRSTIAAKSTLGSFASSFAALRSSADTSAAWSAGTMVVAPVAEGATIKTAVHRVRASARCD